MKVKGQSRRTGAKKRRSVNRWEIVFWWLVGASWAWVFLFTWQAGKVPLAETHHTLPGNIPWSLMCVALGFGATVSVPFVIRFWPKKRWYAFYLGGIFLGLAVAFGITQGGLCLNAWLDKSVPQMHRTRIVGKKHFSGKGARWIFLVKDWRGSEKPRWLRANPDEYEATPIGTALVVTTRSGFFGWEWLVRREFTRDRPAVSSLLTSP